MVPPTSLIPIHDENPTRTFSIVTAVIIAINVAVFLLLQPNFGQQASCGPGDVACQAENCKTVQFFYKWGVVPAEMTEGEQFNDQICNDVYLEDKSLMASLFSSMFLHGGFMHLAGNMLFLWVFGNNIEDRLGKVKFVFFYLLVGLAGTLAHVWFNPDSVIPTVGASGAISGLLGAYAVLFPRAIIHTVVPIPILFFIFGRIRLPAMLVLGMWFAGQFFIGQGQSADEGGGVAWVAHVGGFVAGMALIWLFGGRRRRARPDTALS